MAQNVVTPHGDMDVVVTVVVSTTMGALNDAARWTVVELRVLWCAVFLLLSTLVCRLLGRIPSVRRRMLAPHERAMHPFAGNWQVRCDPNQRSSSHLVSFDLISTEIPCELRDSECAVKRPSSPLLRQIMQLHRTT